MPVSASQTDASSSLLPLRRGREKRRQPGRCAQAALDAEEGGREGGERDGKKEVGKKRAIFTPPHL